MAAQAIVTPDVYWRFNPTTKQVEIISEGVILETTSLGAAAQRVTYHRHELAKASGVRFVETRARKRGREAW